MYAPRCEMNLLNLETNKSEYRTHISYYKNTIQMECLFSQIYTDIHAVIYLAILVTSRQNVPSHLPCKHLQHQDKICQVINLSNTCNIRQNVLSHLPCKHLQHKTKCAQSFTLQTLSDRDDDDSSGSGLFEQGQNVGSIRWNVACKSKHRMECYAAHF